MQLNELFKSDSTFTVDSSAAMWTAHTRLKNNDTLTVNCFKYKAALNLWSIEFDINGDHDLTGEGNEFEVFAHVTAMLKSFFESKSPDQIYMQAEEENRVGLYRRMLRRLLTGWKTISYFDNGDDVFILGGSKKPQFDVVTTDRGIGVQVTSSIFLGYEEGEETPDLEDAEGLGDQLKDELAKAKELSLGEE